MDIKSFKKVFGTRDDVPKHRMQKKVDIITFGEAYEDLSDGLIGVRQLCKRCGFSHEFWRQHKFELINEYYLKLNAGDIGWVVQPKKRDNEENEEDDED